MGRKKNVEKVSNNVLEIQKRLEKTTTKKVKVVGTKQFINKETGEVEEMLVTDVGEKDFNFTKVFMYSLLPQLEVIGNKKIAVCTWIIDHLDRGNVLLATVEHISKETGISVETVRVTIKKLIECDFLRREVKGVYMVNPEVLFRGQTSSRMNALFRFSAIDNDTPSSTTKRMELKSVEKSMGAMQKKAVRLENTIKEMDENEELTKQAVEMQKQWRKVDEESEALSREFEEQERLSREMEEETEE